MGSELSELRWLLLPLYPFIALTLLIGWLAYATRGRKNVDVNVTLLGMRLSVKYEETGHNTREGSSESN